MEKADVNYVRTKVLLFVVLAALLVSIAFGVPGGISGYLVQLSLGVFLALLAFPDLMYTKRKIRCAIDGEQTSAVGNKTFDYAMWEFMQENDPPLG